MRGISIAPRHVLPGEAILDSAKVKGSVLYAVAVEGPHRCFTWERLLWPVCFQDGKPP